MTAVTQGTGFSPIVRQAGLGSSALEHMREVERTEAGRLFSSRSSAAIVLQARSLRDGPVPAFTVAYADLERSEEHTSELQSLMRISYAVFCLKKKKTHIHPNETIESTIDTN